MLIISQNEESIINIYTLTEIWIDTDSPSYVGKAVIKARTNDYITTKLPFKSGLTIGIYNSKDEAMDVLQEIMAAAEEGDKAFYMPYAK